MNVLLDSSSELESGATCEGSNGDGRIRARRNWRKELHLPAAQHRHYASPNRKDVTFWDQIFDISFPYETLLNDVAYTDYHKFSSETRMLRGLDVVPDATTSPASSDRKTGIANPPQCDLYPGLSRRPVDADEHGTLSLNEDNSA
jgi:hypothetical protein